MTRFCGIPTSIDNEDLPVIERRIVLLTTGKMSAHIAQL
jgi:hypothetical protein